MSNKEELKKKVIMGVDPGTTAMGYGVITVIGNKLSLECLGTVQLNKLPDAYAKLKKIYEKVSALITSYKPDEFAIEAPFYGKNPQSMLKLGRAQGVAIAAAASFDLPVTEYAPKKIKQSVTGNGNASKHQVAAMLQQILKYKESPKFLDATDALAAALCHHYQSKNPISAGGHKDWGAFIKANPGRVK